MEWLNKMISTLIGGGIILLFLLFLYLNNGSFSTKYHTFGHIVSFHCEKSYTRHYLVPNGSHPLSAITSYVVKRSKDGGAMEAAKYKLSILLGRKLGGGFWQYPEPHFYTPIFSTRYIEYDEMLGRFDFKLLNKVGFGIHESSFPKIGSSGYEKIRFSDNHIYIDGEKCIAVTINNEELNALKNLL